MPSRLTFHQTSREAKRLPYRLSINYYLPINVNNIRLLHYVGVGAHDHPRINAKPHGTSKAPSPTKNNKLHNFQ